MIRTFYLMYRSAIIVQLALFWSYRHWCVFQLWRLNNIASSSIEDLYKICLFRLETSRRQVMVLCAVTCGRSGSLRVPKFWLSTYIAICLSFRDTSWSIPPNANGVYVSAALLLHGSSLIYMFYLSWVSLLHMVFLRAGYPCMHWSRNSWSGYAHA